MSGTSSRQLTLATYISDKKGRRQQRPLPSDDDDSRQFAPLVKRTKIIHDTTSESDFGNDTPSATAEVENRTHDLLNGGRTQPSEGYEMSDGEDVGVDDVALCALSQSSGRPGSQFVQRWALDAQDSKSSSHILSQSSHKQKVVIPSANEDGKASVMTSEECRHNIFSRSPIVKTSHYMRAHVEAYYDYKDRFSFPWWVDPMQMHDSQGRDIFDPNYDSRTLTVGDLSSSKSTFSTPAMVQWWEVKKDYFDSILLFKMGKFYELFFTDACIAQPVCDLRWMGSDDKAHVGFPEGGLTAQGSKLVDSGFQCVVIEQMETPEEKLAASKAVKREVHSVLTPGTRISSSMSIYERPIIAFVQLEPEEAERIYGGTGGVDLNVTGLKNIYGSFAACYVDAASGRMGIELMADDDIRRPNLRTFLTQRQPSEVLLVKNSAAMVDDHDHQEVPSTRGFGIVRKDDMRKVICRTCPLALLLTLPRCSKSEIQETLAGVSEVETLKKPMDDLIRTDAQRMALAVLCSRLKSVLVYDQIIPYATIQTSNNDDGGVSGKVHMSLDAAALRSLEIFHDLESQVSPKLGTKPSGGLIEVIDRTLTGFGGRMLWEWLCAPLLSPQSITDRNEVVEYFVNNPGELRDCRRRMESLQCDIPRVFSRLKKYGAQGKRTAVFFTSVVQNRFTLLEDFLKALEKVNEIAVLVRDYPVKRIRELFNMDEEQGGGNFPDLTWVVSEVRSKYEKDSSSGMCRPKDGSFAAYEEIRQGIRLNEEKVRLYVRRMGDHLATQGIEGSKLISSKYRYEVEIEDIHAKEVQKILQKDFKGITVSSQRKGHVRLRDEFLETQEKVVIRLEDELEWSLYPFQQELFNNLNNSASTAIETATRAVAELDVLCGFAELAAGTSRRLKWCKPEIVQEHILEARESWHPVIAKHVGDNRFVCNDICLGGEINARCMVLLGFNMGGKSTIQRQTAILFILAQIGCFVPAQKCRLSPVDAVFTRLGAHDALLERKSTFYVEVEEVMEVLNKGTSRSLAIIDEFGRGTSTKDGAALCYSVVKYLAENVQPLCVMSTHFHEVVQKILTSVQGVDVYRMAARVDEKGASLTFLYKLEKGLETESQGVLVAKLCKVPLD